ncbi:hypothetical protein BASA81_017689 [Batrachochytrium salamandrivorans]|nr:hypothetical protein BASA81_017689 [Batrachochytrium salamandrivorans]
MDQAIRIDNRIVERRQEQQYVPRPFRRNPPLSHFVPRSNANQYSSRDYNLPVRQTPLQPSAFPTPPSSTQHRSTDDMDVDFARRGPLTPVERQRRMSQRLCLVCGQSGHLKATCPKSNSRFGSQRHVQALRWMTLTLRCRETTSADFKWRLRLGREPHDSEVLSIFALSSVEKTITPRHPSYWNPSLMLVLLLFVDCGADDVFMDLNLPRT